MHIILRVTLQSRKAETAGQEAHLLHILLPRQAVPLQVIARRKDCVHVQSREGTLAKSPMSASRMVVLTTSLYDAPAASRMPPMFFITCGGTSDGHGVNRNVQAAYVRTSKRSDDRACMLPIAWGAPLRHRQCRCCKTQQAIGGCTSSQGHLAGKHQTLAAIL